MLSDAMPSSPASRLRCRKFSLSTFVNSDVADEHGESASKEVELEMLDLPFEVCMSSSSKAITWRMPWMRIAVLLAAAIVLQGCGWRLQGTARLPEVMSVTYIDTDDRYTDFNRMLRESLEASGARLANSRKEASAIVRIRSDASGQRVLSVSARNTPEEYVVFY